VVQEREGGRRWPGGEGPVWRRARGRGCAGGRGVAAWEADRRKKKGGKKEEKEKEKREKEKEKRKKRNKKIEEK
jgi:hypothetical protein